jgi:hypothetical protein
MNAEDWRRVFHECARAGASLYKGQIEPLVRKAEAIVEQVGRNRPFDRASLDDPQWWAKERPQMVPPGNVFVAAETFLGIVRQLAEAQERLAILEECGAVEYARQQASHRVIALLQPIRDDLRRRDEEARRAEVEAKRAHLKTVPENA